MKIAADFNPRGNVHTTIEISSDIISKNFSEKKDKKPVEKRNFSEKKFEKTDKNFKSKPRKNASREPFAKIDKSSPKVVKK